MNASSSKPDPILLELPEFIGGVSIVLRPWIKGQGAGFFEAVEESREEAERWIPFMSKVGSAEDAEKMIRTWRAKWDLREDTMLLAAWSADSERLVGSAGLVRNDWPIRAFEIGYWIRSSESKKGYGRESARLLFNFCFEYLQAERVIIRVAAENSKSWAIPEALGFVHEGILRRSMADQAGEIHDVKLYAMIRADWTANQS